MKYFGLTISLRVATPLRVYSGGFRGGRAGRAPPPPLKFAKHICYTTLIKQSNK